MPLDFPFAYRLGIDAIITAAAYSWFIQCVHDLLVSMHFDFRGHPVVGRIQFCRGIDDVIGDDFSVQNEVRTRRDGVTGLAARACPNREKLHLHACRPRLAQFHTQRRLRVNHDAAIELSPGRCIRDRVAGNPIVETQDIIRIRLVRIKMAKPLLEFAVAVVADLDDPVLDTKRVREILVERMARDLDRPAREVLAIE
jgi:hypothetical protein